jgi:hypothetical protein
MKPMSLTSPESIASEYKGNKKAIANAARMGLIDPTAALMAGMFIDRMRNAAAEEQKQQTTVAQDVFNPPMQPQAAPQAPMQGQAQSQPQQPQMAQGIPAAQMAAAQPQMAPGVEGLPTGDVGNYAGGGIVAFGDGGDVTDEEARALGYSNAAEYREYKRLYGDNAAKVDVAPLPADDMEVTRIYSEAPEYGQRSSIKKLDYGRISPDQRIRNVTGGISDEVARKLGYRSANELELLGDEDTVRRNRFKDIDMQVENPANPLADMFPALREPESRLFAVPRRAPFRKEEASRVEERPTLQDIRSQRLDLSTPFDKSRGVTTREDAARMEARQAVRDTFGLPGILKGKTDLSTGFRQEGAAVPEDRRSAAQSLPPIADPNAAKTVSLGPNPPKPNVDKYGLPLPDVEGNLERAKKLSKDLVPEVKEESQADAIKATRDLYTAMGVDSDLYKKQRETLEKERGELKSDKQEARNMRLIEAGLGVLAGKSPFAFVNIGEGASPALKGLAQDLKDIKKADRDLTRAQMALDTTENQFKVDQSKSVQARLEKNLERVDKAAQTRATAATSLATSLNALEGSKYEAMLRDLTSRSVAATQLEGTQYSANKQLEGTKYHADRSLEGALAHAGATRYGYDREERGIERIMKDRNVDYVTARGLYFDAKQREADRYNSIRTSLGRANRALEDDPAAGRMRNEISKIEKKSEKDRTAEDKARLAELKTNLNRRRDEVYAEHKITNESLSYIESVDRDISGRAPSASPAPAPAGGGGFVVNTPQGPVSFTTKEQADAFRRQYNLP